MVTIEMDADRNAKPSGLQFSSLTMSVATVVFKPLLVAA